MGATGAASSVQKGCQEASVAANTSVDGRSCRILSSSSGHVHLGWLEEGGNLRWEASRSEKGGNFITAALQCMVTLGEVDEKQRWKSTRGRIDGRGEKDHQCLEQSVQKWERYIYQPIRCIPCIIRCTLYPPVSPTRTGNWQEISPWNYTTIYLA